MGEKVRREVLRAPKNATIARLENSGTYYLDINSPEKQGDYLEDLYNSLPALRKWKVELANRIFSKDFTKVRVYFVLLKIVK